MLKAPLPRKLALLGLVANACAPEHRSAEVQKVDKDSIELGSWSVVPSQGGSWIALDGDRVAVASPGRLVVRQGSRQVAEAVAPGPAPGVPRFVGDRVFWGSGVLDLTSGGYAALVPTMPDGASRVKVHAWSPRGDHLVIATDRDDPARPTRVALLDGPSGTALATLWEGSAVTPTAAWVGLRVAVVGFTDPRVFDFTATEVARIPLAMGPVWRIDATHDETRILVTGRDMVLVDASSWAILDRWRGPWIDGAISPGGRIAAGIDSAGRLQLAAVVADRFHPARTIPIEPPLAGVALADDAVAVVGSGELRLARLTARIVGR